VSINSISNIDKNYLVNNLSEPAGEKENSTSPALTALSQITDKASLSTLSPKLQSVLQAIDNPDGNVLQAISNNISNLQDAFVDAVAGAFDDARINLTHKVTLRLDSQDTLTVAGEHPDKDKIEKLLEETPELATAFKEISSQSEVLRDVGNIGKVIGARTGISSYQDTLNLPHNNSYQISIKGEMSHFYFSKN
jgi:hypothetical protein